MLSQEEQARCVNQASEEYEFALKYRQKREPEWRTVDDLYYGKKKKSLITRANIHVPKMQGTIETFVSKIDDPPHISFGATKEAEKPNAEKKTALLHRDLNQGDWELKDILAKKEAALYGRTQFKKYSTSEDGFTDHLEVVDCLDFVIDPLAGGLDPMKKANFMGQDNIVKSKYEMITQPDLYDKQAVIDLAKSLQSDNAVDNRYNSLAQRRLSLNLSQAVFITEDSIKLVEWYTTYKGKRYYMLFDPTCKVAVRFSLLTDLFSDNEFPFASWAPFARASEYWTPGLGELIKEPNIIQNILLNQMLDNTAYRNYGMKAYDVNKVTNPAELKPQPMGKIAVDGNPNDAIKDITFPDIQLALQMYNSVENIFDKETGITNEAKGVPNTKRMSATEFNGLLDSVASRFTTANKTYSACLKRLAKLYSDGLDDNMTRSTRVRVLGDRGYEWIDATPEELKGTFDILISSGLLDEASNGVLRQQFTEYLKVARTNPRLNQQFLDEKEARMLGLDEDEVQRLLNPELEGDWELIAEAAAENEVLLKKEVAPNPAATPGHIERHLDFARSTAQLDPEVRARIILHAKSEVEIAKANTVLKSSKIIAASMQNSSSVAPLNAAPTPLAPTEISPAAFAPIPATPPGLGGQPSLPVNSLPQQTPPQG